jgi:hypothetical protein
MHGAAHAGSRVARRSRGGVISALRREKRARLLFELSILGGPVGIERRVDHLLQLGDGFSLSIGVQQELGEEEMRGGAVRIVFQRFAEMLLRQFAAAAEQARHLEVPASERAVGGALLECRIDLQHGLELVADLPAILEPRAQPERFGERAHVGGDPEVTLGTPRLERDGRFAGLDARLENGPPLVLRGVAADPVVGARELPGGVEVPGIAGEVRGPDVRRAARAGQICTVGVQRVRTPRRGARECAREGDVSGAWGRAPNRQ